jgi:Cdc6-like AAA superfamily ATPase
MSEDTGFKLGIIYEKLRSLREMDFFDDHRRVKDLLNIIPSLNADDMDKELRKLLYGREYLEDAICEMLCIIQESKDDC